MNLSKERIWPVLLLTAALLLALAVCRVALAEEKAPATSPQYIGTETCKTCHEEIYVGFEKTPHWKTTLNKKGGSEERGCEACHGPGAKHADAGGDKSLIYTFKGKSAAEVDRRCLACHQYGEEHANAHRSQHSANDVGCTSCHSVHHARESQFLLVKKQPELCYGCHSETKSEFSQPFRHRVEQGLVQCTDCHNQHGGSQSRELRSTATQDQVCFKCHTDKAGPFAFEHEPVKTEGCVACHQPHGSANPRLLKRSQQNLLCLECHTLTVDSAVPALPSFHNQSQKYQACTLCHTQIHGSNFDPFLFK
jgi:DmsE family decaheme c-type cytochrome